MMKPKKIPMRRCIATGVRVEKKDLFRIVRTPSGEVIYDPTGKANGRGAYLSKTNKAIEKAKKTNILKKHLEVEIPDALFETLLKELNHA